MEETRILKEQWIEAFKMYLIQEERSSATVEKYMRDIRCFSAYIKNKEINKALVLTYKDELRKRYSISSVNSMLAALNSFFTYMGWNDSKVKQFRIQKKIFCGEKEELSKVEYLRLLKTSEAENNIRLNLVMQTVCATGIRISELKYFTVAAVKKGYAEVTCKNKTRTILIPRKLKKRLGNYVKSRKIASGPVFITKGGKPVNRSNIWKEMKRLCLSAHVDSKKVFPHNLRHLFARSFYALEKDIAKLADILGHSSIETTRIYIISTGEEHQRKLSGLGLVV